MPAKKKIVESSSESEQSDDDIDIMNNKTDSDSDSDSSSESSIDTDSSSSESDNDVKTVKKNKKKDKKNIDTEQAGQKKRGRPRKNITVQKSALTRQPKKNSSSEEEEDELILHIPIYDNENSSSEKNMFTMKSEEDDEEKPKTIKSLSHSDDDVDVKKLLLELKKKDAIIKRLKAGENSKNVAFHDNTPSFTRDTKTKIINLNLIDINKSGKPIVVDKTDIACWWCTHNFSTLPCFLPDRYYNSTFYVFGCFCTYSCVMAYNLGMNDSRSSSRISLIKILYAKIFSSAENIPIAPARELLQKFGGPLSIEEFRNSSLLCKKEFKVAFPPMIPLLPVMNEIPKDQTSNYLGYKQPNKKK